MTATRSLAVCAGLMAAGALFYLLSNADPRPAPAYPGAEVTATTLQAARNPDPSPEPRPNVEVESASAPLPASTEPVSLDNGPPPIKLYRCGAYARLLSESTTADAARDWRRLADRFDEVIALLSPADSLEARDAAPAGPGAAGTPSAAPSPDAVRQSVQTQAEQAGDRRAAWLEESFARCDQEVLWLAKVWASVPEPGGAPQPAAPSTPPPPGAR